MIEILNSGIEKELETLLCKEGQHKSAISESENQIFQNKKEVVLEYEEEKDSETVESDSSVLDVTSVSRRRNFSKKKNVIINH